ncbi:hypothetical protein [Microbacterium stercoris]|uniref:Uncharacterized protein n=1 Tax=Microbacterium stercoris TaxID=2820289 RepID=A0A939QLD7_9MICO|nr:hypothetical protein [Microbacterium stercoris]MBO3665044.1 hypothetical protein [Microbacterium stercoris]
MSRAPSTTWGRAIGFAGVVFFAPLVVALAAVFVLAPGKPYGLSLLAAGGPVALFGAVWLTILTHRRARDVSGLALSAAVIGVCAAAAVALLLPIIGSFPEAGFGGLVYFGAIALVVAVGVYLAIGGPFWLAATALLAAPIVLPGARVSSRRAGLVLGIGGSVLAVAMIATTWISAGAGEFARGCRADVDQAGAPTGTFTWIPLGVRCEWPVGTASFTTDPDWIATIVVVVALSLAAFGVGLVIRSRPPRPLPAVPAERWDAPDDPWHPQA